MCLHKGSRWGLRLRAGIGSQQGGELEGAPPCSPRWAGAAWARPRFERSAGSARELKRRESPRCQPVAARKMPSRAIARPTLYAGQAGSGTRPLQHTENGRRRRMRIDEICTHDAPAILSARGACVVGIACGGHWPVACTDEVMSLRGRGSGGANAGNVPLLTFMTMLEAYAIEVWTHLCDKSSTRQCTCLAAKKRRCHTVQN